MRCVYLPGPPHLSIKGFRLDLEEPHRRAFFISCCCNPAARCKGGSQLGDLGGWGLGAILSALTACRPVFSHPPPPGGLEYFYSFIQSFNQCLQTFMLCASLLSSLLTGREEGDGRINLEQATDWSGPSPWV